MTTEPAAQDVAEASFCNALPVSPRPGLLITTRPLPTLETNDLLFEARFPHLWGQWGLAQAGCGMESLAAAREGGDFSPRLGFPKGDRAGALARPSGALPVSLP